jgi:hypothetical protein
MHAAEWRRLLASIDGLELQLPVDPAHIANAERRLGLALPREVRELYLATDGVYDGPGQWFVMWRLDDLVTRNLAAWRSEGAPRRELLGFGDDGTGAALCVPLDGRTTVRHWSTIDQDSSAIARGLREFWTGWPSGEVST